MTTPSWRSAVWAALGCALLFAGGRATSYAADPLEIDFISSQTGPISFGGKLQAPGAMGLEAYVNKTGGVRGRPIKAVIIDEQSNPSVAVQQMNELIARHVPVVIGPGSTGTCNAVAPVIKTSIVAYCSSPGAHPTVGSYMFGTSFGTDDLIAAGVKNLRLRGFRRIAFIGTTDASGQDGEKGFDAAMADPANKELVLVDREHYNGTDLTVAAQIVRIKASAPQAVVAWASGSPVGTFFRNAHEAALDVPVLTTPNNQNMEQMTASADFLPTELLAVTAPFGTPEQIANRTQRAAVGAFYDSLKALGIPTPAYPSHTVWDPGLIVVAAYKKYGFAMTAAQAYEFISTLRGFIGINGPYDFPASPQRGLNAGSAVVIRWDRAKKTWVAASKIGGAVL
jgi:branched-chain amino acid transport system substrate-binding protein